MSRVFIPFYQGKNRQNMARLLPPKDKRFKKGESGNPKGRPVGSFSLTRAVKEYLLEMAKDGESYGDKLKKAAVLRAITKSDVLAKEIWDRVDGKVPQQTDITSRGERIEGINYIVPSSKKLDETSN